MAGPFSNTSTSSPSNVMYGRGVLLIGEVVDSTGVPAYWEDLGNVSDFTIEQDVETDSRRNYRSCTAVDDLELTIATKLNMSFTGDESTANNLSKWLLGQMGTITTTGATDISTAVLLSTTHSVGQIFQLVDSSGNPLLDITGNGAVTIQKDSDTDFSSGATALVEGTDYTLDKTFGTIQMLTADLSNPNLGFTYVAGAETAKTLTTTNALTSGTKVYALMFKGRNAKGCAPHAVYVYSSTIRGEGGLNLLGEKNEMQFSGSLEGNALAKAYYGSDSDYMHAVKLTDS